jgi:hypothetical protein
MPGGSGRWGVPAVSVGHTDRTVEGSKVGGPVRCDGLAVRQQFAGVLEDHDAVAEQAPALLGVADNGVRRFAIRSRRSRTRRRVRAHISASWLFHVRSLLVFSVDVQCAAGLVIAHMAHADRFRDRHL